MDCELSYSVPVSSFGIDFTDRIVSPTLVVNQQSANLLKTHKKKKNTADMHLSAIGGTVLGYIALLLKICEDLWSRYDHGSQDF